MPADADILCEYYITSNLKSSSSSSSSTVNNLKNKLFNNTTTTTAAGCNNSDNNNKNFKSILLESIDFIKYDKNPMDYLKSKYQLLNTTATATTISNGNGTTVINGNSSQQQQQQQSNSKLQINGNGTGKLVQQASTAAAVATTASATNKNSLDLNWNKIKKTGIGLLNLGNNCYLNATLQCLAYTPPLSQWLMSRPHSAACRFKTIKGFCSLCEVEKIINDIFNGCNGCAKPNTLCFNIRKISNVFGVGTQEDASEFFTTLLESMAKSIKYTMASIAAANNTNKKPISTIFDDIFSFQFRSRITCSNCGRLSDTIENTNTWPIDVKFVQDVRKGMQHFLREEILENENAYKCDKCNKKTKATKKYSIRTAPNILVLHLKRFDYSYIGKLSHFVMYPETLNMKWFVPELESSNEKTLRNTNYKLYGVLVHMGSTSHSGHYYSYVRAPNNSWYKADDQRVNSVQLGDALRQNAYLLFYTKITDNQQLVSNDAKIQEVSSTVKTVNSNFNANKAQLVNNSNGSCAAAAASAAVATSTVISRNFYMNGKTTVTNGHSNGHTTSATTTTTTTTSSSSYHIEQVKFKNENNLDTKIILKFKKPDNSDSNNNNNGEAIESTNGDNNENDELKSVKKRKKKDKLKKKLKKLKTSDEATTTTTTNNNEEEDSEMKLKKKKKKKNKNKFKNDETEEEKNGHGENDVDSSSSSKKRKLESTEDSDHDDSNNNNNDNESNSSSGSSSISSKKKNKKKKLKVKKLCESNGLSILKGYGSASSCSSSTSSLSSSPSSPESSIPSPLSPASSLSSLSNDDDNNNNNNTSSTNFNNNNKSTINGNSNSNLNQYNNNNHHQINNFHYKSSNKNEENVFSITKPQIKTWDNRDSNKFYNNGNRNGSSNNNNEMDEYNEDFDKPFVRKKIAFKLHKAAKPQFNRFHNYTHKYWQRNNNFK